MKNRLFSVVLTVVFIGMVVSWVKQGHAGQPAMVQEERLEELEKYQVKLHHILAQVEVQSQEWEILEMKVRLLQVMHPDRFPDRVLQYALAAESSAQRLAVISTSLLF